MQLNIKHPDAYRLARAIADATGTSLTDAVVTALRHESERLESDQRRRADDIAERMRRIEAIGTEVRARLTPEQVAYILDDDNFYDENGLPR